MKNLLFLFVLTLSCLSPLSAEITNNNVLTRRADFNASIYNSKEIKLDQTSSCVELSFCVPHNLPNSGVNVRFECYYPEIQSWIEHSSERITNDKKTGILRLNCIGVSMLRAVLVRTNNEVLESVYFNGQLSWISFPTYGVK